MTFYRHFQSKEDLIVAYLEFRAEMVAGYLGDPARIAASFFRSCQAVIRSAAREPLPT